MKVKKHWRLVSMIMILLLAALACGTGFSTTHSHSGNQGHVMVKFDNPEDSYRTDITIYEDYSWEDVTLTITITVEAGSYRATFTDNDGRTMTLDASVGNPASAKAQMTTDAFGDIEMQSESSGAQGVVINIEYTQP